MYVCDRLRLFPDWLIGWMVPSVWWAVSPRPGEIYPERLLALPYHSSSGKAAF